MPEIDFKNFENPGQFPSYFQIIDEISDVQSQMTLEHDNIYHEDEKTYEKKFDYSFGFIYRNKISGKAYVYRGGFLINFTKPNGQSYLSSHCNHFSMPMCQHFNSEGKFTQYFIDRISEVLEKFYENALEDEVATSFRYLNQRKGH